MDAPKQSEKHLANLKKFGNGKRRKWMRNNKITQQQFDIAEGLLMTGPRSQRPTFRAIQKMLGILRSKIKPGPHGYRPWRAYLALYL